MPLYKQPDTLLFTWIFVVSALVVQAAVLGGLVYSVLKLLVEL